MDLSAQNSPDNQPECRSFEDLAASRRGWIETVLRPWARQATRAELRKAEQEWFDIAGRVDPAASLWTWAWERFSCLTHADLAGVNETREVIVRLIGGTEVAGFPDSRRSVRGDLHLVKRREDGVIEEVGPVSIDEIHSVRLFETE